MEEQRSEQTTDQKEGERCNYEERKREIEIEEQTEGEEAGRFRETKDKWNKGGDERIGKPGSNKDGIGGNGDIN